MRATHKHASGRSSRPLDMPVTLRHIHIKEVARGAVLFIDREGGEHWIPTADIIEMHQSQLFFDSSIVISQWAATQEGLA